MIKTKVELNTERMSTKEFEVYNQALLCDAPIQVALRHEESRRVHEALGSRAVAPKHIVDTRNGRKISYGQARQIIAKYQKMAA